MSDSKLGAQARGQRNLVPEVLDKAPAGTELGWVVWVANPSSGGGGTVDQGKKGSSGESWYVQDGSGLLATTAKQDTANASLAAIDSKLGSPLAVTGPLTNAELRAAAVPVSAASLPLPTGAATELTVASILGQLDNKTSTLATQVTAAAILAQLDAKTSTLATASAQTTSNTSLATIATQQTDGTQKTQISGSVAVTGPLTDAQLRAAAVPISASALPLPAGAATSALQGGGLPAALVGGKLDVNLGTSSITLPVSGPLTDAQLRATPVPVSGTVTVASTTANQGTGAGAAAPWSVELSDGAGFYTGAKTGQFPTTLGQTTKAASLSVALASDQVGSAGTAASNVLSVQGIASMTPVQVSQATAANLNATVAQGAGSGAAGTFWYTRNTDGTNTQPTMDTAARSGFQRITDGTNTAAVKAASTAPTASDTALVATLSPNSRPGGGSSFTWFSTATGSLLKTGAGVARRIIIGSNVAGTVTLHDNTSAAGTVITSVTSTTSTPCNQVELGVAFSTGLYCTTTGSGISVTVVYD